jgi:hypothetical protein
MRPVYPDLEWYSEISERKGVVGRCPFAGIKTCPRYFYSLELLSDLGINMKMSSAAYDAVRTKWNDQDVANDSVETAVQSFGYGDNKRSFLNICPEVAFEAFKLFAYELHEYYGSLEREYVEERLVEEGTDISNDWRWRWGHIEPMHYTMCPTYSRLKENRPMPPIAPGDTYNIAGQVGAIGPNARAESNTFNQSWAQAAAGIDLPTLLLDLNMVSKERAQRKPSDRLGSVRSHGFDVESRATPTHRPCHSVCLTLLHAERLKLLGTYGNS